MMHSCWAVNLSCLIFVFFFLQIVMRNWWQAPIVSTVTDWIHWSISSWTSNWNHCTLGYMWKSRRKLWVHDQYYLWIDFMDWMTFLFSSHLYHRIHRADWHSHKHEMDDDVEIILHIICLESWFHVSDLRMMKRLNQKKFRWTWLSFVEEGSDLL